MNYYSVEQIDVDCDVLLYQCRTELLAVVEFIQLSWCCCGCCSDVRVEHDDDDDDGDDAYNASINADDEAAASNVSEGRTAGQQRSASADSRHRKTLWSPTRRTTIQPQV